jgi:hypothetical protein
MIFCLSFGRGNENDWFREGLAAIESPTHRDCTVSATRCKRIVVALSEWPGLEKLSTIPLHGFMPDASLSEQKANCGDAGKCAHT